MSLGHDEVMRIVTRLVSGGPLNALPRRSADLEALLALAAANFPFGRTFREEEVNERLIEWLETFTSDGVDHVTVRRELVDRLLLLRDAAGAAYRQNAQRVDRLIDASARTIDPGAILAGALERREARKRLRSA
jgi:hypothetical protein